MATGATVLGLHDYHDHTVSWASSNGLDIGFGCFLFVLNAIALYCLAEVFSSVVSARTYAHPVTVFLGGEVLKHAAMTNSSLFPFWVKPTFPPTDTWIKPVWPMMGQVLKVCNS